MQAVSPPSSASLPPIQVNQVPLDRRSVRLRLLRLGSDAYVGDGNYVTPPIREQMAALDPGAGGVLAGLPAVGLIAVQLGRPVARMVVRVGTCGLGAFSNYENVAGPAAARALVDAAMGWLAEHGGTRLVGPVGVGPHDPLGLLVSGFSRSPTVATPYNPPRYVEHLEAAGLVPRWRLPGWRWRLCPSSQGDHNDQLDRLLAQQRVTIREADLASFDREIGAWRQVIGEGIAEPWRPAGNRAAFSELQAFELPRLSLPGSVLFAERDGVPIGVVVTVPDVNRILPRKGWMGPLAWWRLIRKRAEIAEGRVRFLVSRSGEDDPAIPLILLLATGQRARSRGVESLELSCGGEHDLGMMRAARALNARREREFVIFERT